MSLILFNQFLLKEAVRSPVYLANPNIIPNNEIDLPRLSVVHYLDLNSNNHFPTRNLVYFNNVPKNKKIPVYHIEDLDYKVDISTLANKTALAEMRKWNKENLKYFRYVNLLETPNTDINTIAVFNYNLLKDLYKYKTSPLSSYNQYLNLYKTYFNYIKKAINADKESYHFIRLEVPSLIPSYNILNAILKFNDYKYSRIVRTNNFRLLMDFYKWLNNSTRNSSSLKDITDEESNRIILEIIYKNYIAFLPLSVIRSINKESKLESKIKLPPDKVQRLFIVFIHKLQSKVDKLLEEIAKSEIKEDENKKEKALNEEKEEAIEQELENDDETDDSDVLDSTTNKDSESDIYISGLNKGSNKELNPKSLTDIDKIDELESNGLYELLETLEEGETNKIADDIYEETILKVKNEEENPQKVTPIKTNISEEQIQKLIENETLEDKFNLFLEEAKEFKTLSANEIRSVKKVFENRKNLKSPYDNKVQIDEFKQLKKEDTNLDENKLKLNIDNELVTEDLKKEVLFNLERQYIDKVLHKDVASVVTDIEKSGIIVKEYIIDKEKSALGEYDIHKVVLKPLDGKESTVYFRLPKITSEGEWYGSGIKYRLRKQRTDLPIRKISHNKVALTSNYGKLFVYRTERKAFDSYSYLVDYIKDSYLNNESREIISISPGNSFDNARKLPNTYMYMSIYFDTIKTNKYLFNFNYNNITNYIEENLHNKLIKENLVFVGTNKNSEVLVMNTEDEIINYNTNEKLGTLYDILNIPQEKIPSSFTSLNVLGNEIPLGIVLCYYMGISNLIALTNTKYQILSRNARYEANKNDVVLLFDDYKLVLSPSKEYLPIFNGLLYFKNKLKEIPLDSLDEKEIYLELFEFRNLNTLHLQELENLKDLFLDSITINVLEEMNEPTSFIKLLLRANEMLLTMDHPDMNDPNYSRIRGYDRVPGFVYRALTESIREYKLKKSSNAKITLDPYKVWNYMLQDNTKKLCEDSNPIGDLKEVESVTLTGIEGLSKDAVPMKLRHYHANDMGLFSEATVDSGDVAINTYLTPYAKLKNVRGMVDTDNKEIEENKSKIFSTSALLIPGVEYDDPKRINFISIQNGHTIPSPGYQQPILRTEYEYVMPYKVGELYCKVAKQNGTVISKTDKLLIVEYEDKTKESVMIGKRYGRLEGTVYSHSLVTNLNKGDKFKASDILAYNEYFFEPDWLDPNRLIFKFGRNINVALAMTNEVFEDSSSISEELSKEVKMNSIKEKSFIIDFKKNIVNLLPVGTKVGPNDILFTIVDENTDYSNLSPEAISMLQSLANISPKAKVQGIIDKYEVRYNGDISDMSPSLRKLVNELDKREYEETKGTEYEVVTGQVSSEYRVEGRNLPIDTLELKVYLNTEVTMAIGDKAVFAGQMKSVNSTIFSEKIYTESGEKVDAFFSQKGILNRIVMSMYLIGTTNRLLRHLSKLVAKKYFG